MVYKSVAVLRRGRGVVYNSRVLEEEMEGGLYIGGVWGRGRGVVYKSVAFG